jgi:spermidine synthase
MRSKHSTRAYLVSHVGIAISFRVAAICNLAVGLTALLWPGPALVLPAGDRPVPDEGASDAAGSLPSAANRTRRLVLAAFTVSGFVGLALEIVWFRTLVIYMPATTYAFTTILAVLLGGFAAGSAIARFWVRRDRDWILRLACLQMGAATAAVASLAALAWTYGAGWRTSATLHGTALAVFPTALLMGVAFPIGLHCWARTGPEADAHVGDQVGRFYVFNLAGSILGALMAGFVLVPRFGTRGSLIIAASPSLIAGLALLIPVRRSKPRVTSVLAAGGLGLWIGHRPETEYKLIARTFLTAFPHTTAWGTADSWSGRSSRFDWR